jgi:hypothetical protein
MRNYSCNLTIHYEMYIQELYIRLMSPGSSATVDSRPRYSPHDPYRGDLISQGGTDSYIMRNKAFCVQSEALIPETLKPAGISSWSCGRSVQGSGGQA